MEEKRKAMEDRRKEVMETYNLLKNAEVNAKREGDGTMYFMASNQAIGAMRVIRDIYGKDGILMDEDGVYITRLGD